jgi:hypothetical protein
VKYVEEMAPRMDVIRVGEIGCTPGCLEAENKKSA